MKILRCTFTTVALIPFILQADEIPEGYQPLVKAVTTTIHAAPAKAEGLAGYLGAATEARDGALVVTDIAMDSAAARAGLQKADRITSVDGNALATVQQLRALIQSKSPGDAISLQIMRGADKKSINAALDAVSRPRVLGERAIIGLRMAAASDHAGIDIAAVTEDKPAARAGLRLRDRIMSVDGEELGEAKSLADLLTEKKPGDEIVIVYRRAQKLFRKTIKLEAEDADAAAPGEEKRVLTNLWKKPVFRLAVIGIEFSDGKHNPVIPVREWEEAYFSRDSYTKKNATGQQVFGSMADYYQEVSCGRLKIEGKAFDWVEAKMKKMEYNVSNRSKAKVDFFTVVLQAIEKRDGAEALKDFDGIAFIYSGIKPLEAQRSGILWPHRSSVKIGGKMWPYVIVPEGGDRMANISTMCHEFGHILGLPDLYARPENPGSEGAGIWTVMSNQIRNGRPQHPCAWCKEQLGWLAPAVIDPSVKQKIVLGAVEGSTTECAKILVRPDGSEYLLLENRRKSGFDASLPAEGLLIWRIVANRPILEESHGVEGPAGPRVFLTSVPWPTQHNSSFTPYTTPSSRSQMGGGSPVWITNIRQLKDGRVSFEVGYEYE